MSKDKDGVSVLKASYSDPSSWDKCGYVSEDLSNKLPSVPSCHVPKESVVGVNDVVKNRVQKIKGAGR